MSTPSVRPVAAEFPRMRQLRRMAWALLVLLILESLLGIFANLFITLPCGDAIVPIFTSIPVLALHVFDGFAMLLLAAYFLLLAHRAGLRRLRNVAALEVLFVAFAIQEGFAFAATQNNDYSFGMEVGFLLAILGVARLLYLLGHQPVDVPTDGIPVAV
jgi:heme A synthase